MNSKQLTLEVSWANIEAWILSGLQSVKGIPPGLDVRGLTIPGIDKTKFIKVVVNTVEEDEGADVIVCR